jgi:hypothetical protein
MRCVSMQIGIPREAGPAYRNLEYTRNWGKTIFLVMH